MALITREQVLNETSTCRARLHDQRYRAAPLQAALRERIDLIKGMNPSSVALGGDSLLHTLAWALSQPEVVDPKLLAEYLTELIRFMENAGAGLDFRKVIDQAIEYYRTVGEPVVDLYLAKVEYQRLTDTESPNKEEALEAAARSAQGGADLIRVLLKRTQYYIDTSQYQQSIETAEQCMGIVSADGSLEKYMPKVLDLLGITYVYLFDYDKAKSYLAQACQLGQKYGDLHTLGEALHYLGRVATEQGDLGRAMRYFVESMQYQPDNLADSAWYHLRMGNLLVSSHLIGEAKDHLRLAQDLFMQIDYTGSALVQIELAWADVYRSEKEPAKAEQHMLKAIGYAKQTGFYRGELLSFVNLFWLQLFYLHRLDKAIYTFLVAMMNKELRRNTGLRLVWQYLFWVLSIPYKKIVGAPYNVAGIAASTSNSVDRCLCPLHNKSTGKHEPSIEPNP